LDLLRKTLDNNSIFQAVQQIPTTANINPLSLGDQIRYIPTGIPSLDEVLRGGIRTALVTEVVGTSGAGKTQLALQLCIMAARYNQGAIYIDTEQKMTPSRLHEMGREWRRRFMTVYSQGDGSNKLAADFDFSYNLSATQPTPNSQYVSQTQGQQHDPANDRSMDNTIGSFKYSEQLLGNLTVYHPKSTTELLEQLSSLEDEILHRNQIALQETGITTNPAVNKGHCLPKYPVRLLIVDSIAAPIRRDFGADSAPQRAAAVFQCAQTLKQLADQLHLAVIVINQVGSTSMEATNTVQDADGMGSGSDLFSRSQAALGTSWHHCVTTRLEMESGTEESAEHVHGSLGQHQSSVRKISLRKSGLSPFATIPFEVTTLGLEELSRSHAP
jgi:RecA/RadA recombinase